MGVLDDRPADDARQAGEGGDGAAVGGVDADLVDPRAAGKGLLAAIPFVLVFAAYGIGSSIRLAENPAHKVLPSLGQMLSTIGDYAFVRDKRTGQYRLFSDTLISLKRLVSALGLSVLTALVFGIAAGFIPWVRATLLPFVAAFSLIPPITVLPILAIQFLGNPLDKKHLTAESGDRRSH